ncbi:hypothetical protein [Pseudomonas silesiensis]|jgi:hypothetical protein|uniref:Uncharacterized protein n=1 Tax=Pseudomonas silesiensis TaxID=1853130 RepID=A0A191YW90_9PSED|nr:hypothetical protein [Pseudomonas silesiensis]ANJ57029.1 hypothetical protein PMA3_18495 [Pseudomonas silesiensis]VVP08589.1 hypothetical protein PS874_03070 [Pseudomonas fluorescens]
MQLHEAIDLKEAYSVSGANKAVQEGWKLLAIAPGANGVTYVLGKQADKEKPKLPTADEIARANNRG